MRKDLLNALKAERDALTKAINLLDPPEKDDEPIPVKKMGLKASVTATTAATVKAAPAGDRAPRGQVKEECYKFIAAHKGKPVSVKAVADAVNKPYTQVYLTINKDERLKKVGKALFAVAGIKRPVAVEKPEEAVEEPEEAIEDEEMVELPEDEEEAVEVTE